MSAPNLFSGPQAMTLTQFTTAIGNAVRMSPVLQGAWVVAELSDVRVSGGHCYMELIEKNALGQTVAKIRATIWQSRFNYVRQKFLSSTGRDIMTGMKVMLYGAASHHSLYGLSFTVNDIDPSYTLGDLERLRREILMRLHREGVIEMNKRVPMPPAPQRIAVVSAEGAAGYGDFINQLAGNPDGFVFYPCLFPAVMQGERTSSAVRAALEKIRQTAECWDCVAIVRGGGATTDLNGFDDYDLARAVATFPLPIVVGIGHERDRTVLDEIAHTRMKTPTAVAAFFIDRLRTSIDYVAGMVDRIARFSSDSIQGEQRRLANCEAMIPVVVLSRLGDASRRLEALGQLVKAHSDARVAQGYQMLGSLGQRVAMAADMAMHKASSRIENLAGLVDALSPANTLRRGYSVTRVDGRAVTSASALRPGSVIETELADGRVASVVKEQ